MDAPILLVTDSSYAANPFGAYLGEILKTEGFFSFHRVELGAVDLPLLQRFSLVVLAEAALTELQAESLRSYVLGGGKLLAMRPDTRLSGLFGLHHEGRRPETLWQYVGVDAESEQGSGIENGPLQFHGAADQYRLDGARAVAWLHDSWDALSPFPAVALNRFGSGQAVAFSYDLARSVAMMRQGNPGWACGPDRCEDGDGQEGIRPVDSFLRQSGESWVNPARIPVPQADEQQRLLSNCLMALADGSIPLPRLWCLPAGKRAALVMTGDGDEIGFDAFDEVIRATEEYGGYFSAYLHLLNGDPTREQVDSWIARGHEVSLHVADLDGRVRPTLSTLSSAYDRAYERFTSLYGRRPGPSERNHALAWYGWITGAEIALKNGLKVDFNFYHGRQWKLEDGRWVNGYFTGSGLPQRFVREDGELLDIFQLLTPWTDETQLYRQQLGTEGATRLVREMLDLAERRYPTVFVANFHPGGWKARQTEPWARNMMAEAASRGVPIWSGEQLYRFIAARDGARFSDLEWDGSRLTFALESAEPPEPLALMLPARFAGRALGSVECDGAGVTAAIEAAAGREYAFLSVAPGFHHYVVTYGMRGSDK